MKSSKLVALTAAIIGAVGSLGFLLSAGRNTPLLLLILFVGWVALPFVVLASAAMLSERWSAFTRSALLAVSILVTIGSLAVYCYFTLWPLESTPARTWLIVPGVAVIVIAMIPIAVRLTRR